MPSPTVVGQMKLSFGQGLTATKRNDPATGKPIEDENDPGHPFQVDYTGTQTWGLDVGCVAAVGLSHIPQLVGVYTEKVVDYLYGICFEGVYSERFIEATFVGVIVPLLVGGLMNPAMYYLLGLLLIKVAILVSNKDTDE